ncbi:hypothetical protein Tco_0599462 [Tanacetum coccineum]
MDVKSAFLYGTIKEEVQQKEDGIFISQDKYVAEILKKFDFATVKTASTPMEPDKALVKDEEADSVDVHLYRSMIGSLMYLTTFRPDIMFAVCACARDSPFDLEAFFDSDYAGASLNRKSTTGGCQFLGKRLISWQCKKHTIVANSTTEAEYVAAVNCYGQVLWIQNQMLDYGFNFMNTKIYIDNESTICIIDDLVIKIHTGHNVADLLTKAFDVSRFNFLVASIEGHISGSGEGSMEYTFELMGIVPPTPHDSPLTGGYTPESDEGRLKLKELIAMCIKLSKQVLDLEKEKDAQAVKILKLKQRVKKLERNRKSSISHPRRRIYRQVESSDDDLDKENASKQERTSGQRWKKCFKISWTEHKRKKKQEEATNAALAEEFDEIQARMDADHELVVRLQLRAKKITTIGRKGHIVSQITLKEKETTG